MIGNGINHVAITVTINDKMDRDLSNRASNSHFVTETR